MAPSHHTLRLPAPYTGQWDWQLEAACRGMDVDLFFSPPGERGTARARRERSARRVCAGCRVRRECAEFARTAGEPYGVWGGLTEAERRSEPRHRARARHHAEREEHAA